MNIQKVIVSKGYYPFDIPKVEEKYKCSYIGDFCIKDKYGNWTNNPIAIFYQENPKIELGHSHYMGLFSYYDDRISICNGESAFSEPLTGVLTDSGYILVSCYRHHYNNEGNDFIDGGRDYIRCNENAKLVKVIINKDKLEINE